MERVSANQRFGSSYLRFTIHYLQEQLMTERIHNFSAGPAVLPVPVLEEAQRDLLSLPGVGMVGNGD